MECKKRKVGRVGEQRRRNNKGSEIAVNVLIKREYVIRWWKVKKVN
jgi:hypothetical protein